MPRPPAVHRFDQAAFARHIMAVMRQRRAGREEVAAACGLPIDFLTSIARSDHRPTVDTFLALCHWAGADPGAFHQPPPDPAALGAGSVFTYRTTREASQ